VNADEKNAAYFESGWRAALNEVVLSMKYDKLAEFLDEQRRYIDLGPSE
jgi:hypothetical protein